MRCALNRDANHAGKGPVRRLTILALVLASRVPSTGVVLRTRPPSQNRSCSIRNEIPARCECGNRTSIATIVGGRHAHISRRRDVRRDCRSRHNRPERSLCRERCCAPNGQTCKCQATRKLDRVLKQQSRKSHRRHSSENSAPAKRVSRVTRA